MSDFAARGTREDLLLKLRAVAATTYGRRVHSKTEPLDDMTRARLIREGEAMLALIYDAARTSADASAMHRGRPPRTPAPIRDRSEMLGHLRAMIAPYYERRLTDPEEAMTEVERAEWIAEREVLVQLVDELRAKS